MRREITWLTEDEWKEERQNYLTATAASNIMGLNRYCSVARAVTDKNKSVDLSNNAYVIVGTLLEDVVVRVVNIYIDGEYEGLTKVDWQNNKEVLFCKVPKIKLAATPDARDSNSLLECKTTKPANYTRWLFEPPLHYVMQLHTQLFCTDIEYGRLAILSTNLSQNSPSLNIPISIFHVERSERLEELLIERTAAFWHAYDTGEKLTLSKNDREEIKKLVLSSFRKIV